MNSLDIFKEALKASPSCPRPMLATALDDKTLEQVAWPMLGSYKVDGYRCQLKDGVAYARSGKPHPCKAVQAWAKTIPYPLDGELIVPGVSFNQAGGLLRRADYSGPFKFLIFDLVQDGLKAQERFQFLQSIQSSLPTNCKLLSQVWLSSLQEALDFESEALTLGFEGIVLRKPGALYKHGRGTLRDQTMLKLKRFKTAEAKVLSVEPRMFNSNTAQQTPLGYTERSTAKDGLLETNVLGKLNCVGLTEPFKDIHFSIGNFDGLTDQDKIQLLAEPPIGAICTFKYFPEGILDKPRHPVWLAWRPDWDIDQGEYNAEENN